jgi:uncharacterized protein (TIGR03437 family)
LTFATQYLLTVSADDGGTVTPAGGWQSAGASLTLNPVAKAGFVFSGWEGACSGTGACNIVMNGPMAVKADFSPVQATTPVISSGGVVGAGLSSPPVTALSPDGAAIIFGTSFAPAGTLAVVGSGNLVNGNVSTEMDGVCVLVGSAAAPVLALTPTQINFQVPQTVTAGTLTVQVVTGCGTASEQRSNIVTAMAQSAAPEFFYFTHTSSGQNPIAATDLSTGVTVGTPGLLSGVASAPARPGDLLSLYATGLGLTSPLIAAGELPAAAASITGSIHVSVGSTTLASSDILYAGVTPSTAGLYQINIRLPISVPNGNQPVQVTVNGIASPAGGYITVQQ